MASDLATCGLVLVKDRVRLVKDRVRLVKGRFRLANLRLGLVKERVRLVKGRFRLANVERFVGARGASDSRWATGETRR